MKIGLLGEAPHDTNAIVAILSQIYNDQHEYVPMLNRIRGSQLDSQKTKTLLRKEFEIKKTDLVIFIRDLDALENDAIQLEKRKAYFTDFKTIVDRKAIYLLNIYELEALILADLEVFNNEFGCNVPVVEDPMLMEEPKEYLKQHCSKFSESQSGEIIAKLRIEKLRECRYFEQFLIKLDEKLRT